MVDIETLKMVKDDLFLKSTRIPNFLNTSSQIDFMLWAGIRHITGIMLTMVNRNIQSDSYIHLQSDAIDSYIDEIMSVVDKDRYLYVQRYLNSFIDYCLTQTTTQELFESAHNLIRLKERINL